MNCRLTPSKKRANAGAILLEVVLALALFLAAAVVIGAGLNSSLEGVERQKLRLHAVDLAISVMSELQMGIRSANSPGPEPLPAPYDHWSCQLSVSPAEDELGRDSGLSRIEVTIRHLESTTVYRLGQTLMLPSTVKSAPSLSAEKSVPFGTSKTPNSGSPAILKR